MNYHFGRLAISSGVLKPSIYLIFLITAMLSCLHGLAQSSDLEVQLYLDRCDSLLQAGNLDAAMQILTVADTDETTTLNETQRARLKSKVGIIYQMKGDYNNALNQQLKALELAEEADYPTLTSEILNNIGAIHHIQDNFEDALTYYSSCLELREQLDNKKDLALSYNNFGS